MSKWYTKLAAYVGLAAAMNMADAQCNCAANPSPPPIRVDVNYVPTPGGPFLKVQNCTPNPDGPASCSAIMVNGRRVRLADPTILVLKPPASMTEYYVTGTADDYGTANFPIFKSTDLLNWTFHMFAFDDRQRKAFDGDDCASHAGFPATDRCYFSSATTTACRATPFDDRPDGKCTNRVWKPCCDTMHFPSATGTRKFKNFWAPQLYTDPRDTNWIYLQFTAFDYSNVPPGTPANADVFQLESLTQQTIFVARMSRYAFRNQHIDRAKRFGGVTNQTSAPLGYGYDISATSATPWQDGVEGTRDGGTSLGADDPGNPGDPCLRRSFVVPSSGDLRNWNCALERESRSCPSLPVGRFQYKNASVAFSEGDAPKTWISLDGDVYFDDLGNGVYKPWLLYTWRREHASNPTDSALNYMGNNVAAFPLLTNSLLDVSDPNLLLPMAYRYNTKTGPTSTVGTSACLTGTPTRVFNGIDAGIVRACDPSPAPPCQSASPSCDMLAPPCPAYGIAEGPAVLQRGNARYLIYSRNGFGSRDYNMVYRARRVPMANMGLPNWHKDDANEKRLLFPEGFDSRAGNRRGMGHGEAFPWKIPHNTAEDGRYYLIFHVNDHDFDSQGRAKNSRYPWFKELTFSPPPAGLLSESGVTGEIEPDRIEPMTDSGLGGLHDATEFIVLFVCPADFNQDDGVGPQDIFDMLNAHFENDIAADINGDELISTQDIFDYLNLFFVGCQ